MGNDFARCSWCKEEVKPGEELEQPGYHLECAVRSVAGSAAHQLKECTCYGGGRHDPPGVSRRDSARLAYHTFRLLNGEPL